MAVKETKTFHIDDSRAYDSTLQHNIVIAPRFFALTSGSSGTSLPKYLQIISDGKSATTAFNAYRRSVNISPGSISVNFTRGKVTLTDTYVGIASNFNGPSFILPKKGDAGYYFPQSTIDEAVARARSKVFSELSDRNHSLQAQVFVAELGKTLQQLRSPFEGLRSLLLRLAQTRAKNARSLVKPTAKDLSSQYLEFRFGFLPLVQDINDIIKQFDEKAADGASTLFRKKGFSESSTTSVGVHSATPGLEFTTSLTYKYRAKCYISGATLAQTQQRLSGLAAIGDALTDFMELPSTVWELIPYSFLVDYFINIGDIIEAVTTGTSNIRYTSESVVLETTMIRSTVSYRTTDTNHITSVSGFVPKVVTSRLSEVSRNGGPLAIPPVTVSFPGSNVRLANTLALLLQKL